MNVLLYVRFFKALLLLPMRTQKDVFECTLKEYYLKWKIVLKNLWKRNL